MEVHHILEKRFVGKEYAREMLSIALTKSEHLKYTILWRLKCPLGSKYGFKHIANSAVDIYKDDPELLAVALLSLKKYLTKEII